MSRDRTTQPASPTWPNPKAPLKARLEPRAQPFGPVGRATLCAVTLPDSQHPERRRDAAARGQRLGLGPHIALDTSAFTVVAPGSMFINISSGHDLTSRPYTKVRNGVLFLGAPRASRPSHPTGMPLPDNVAALPIPRRRVLARRRTTQGAAPVIHRGVAHSNHNDPNEDQQPDAGRSGFRQKVAGRCSTHPTTTV